MNSNSNSSSSSGTTTTTATLPPEEWPQTYDGLDDGLDRVALSLMIVGSLLSFLAGVGVLVETWADQRAGGVANNSITRILFCITLGLSLFNLGRMFATLPIPVSFQEYHPIGHPMGNELTCTLQGLSIFFGLISLLLWDVTLSLTYVLLICYNWTSTELQKMERIAHGIIWTFTVGVSIGALVTKSFNQDDEHCSIASLPKDCNLENNDHIECIRGEQAPIFLLLLQSLLVISVIGSAAAMIKLYCYVRRIEQRNARYATSSNLNSYNAPPSSSVAAAPAAAAASNHHHHNSSVTTEQQQQQHNNNQAQIRSSETKSTTTTTTTTTTGGRGRNSSSSTASRNSQRKKSRAVGIQGMLYASTQLITGLPFMIASVVYEFTGQWNDYLGLILLTLSCLTGFVLFYIFQRTRPEMKTRYGRLLQRIFQKNLLGGCKCCCCCRSNWSCSLQLVQEDMPYGGLCHQKRRTRRRRRQTRATTTPGFR